MLISKVPALLAMSEGSVPEGIRGTVTQVYPLKHSQYGTIQNATISGDGQTMRIVFSKKAEVPKSWIGRELYATCSKGNRGGLQGLKRKDNHYNGVTTPEIWVQETADLSIDPPDDNRTPAPAQQQNNQGQNRAPQQTRPTGQPNRQQVSRQDAPPQDAPPAGYDVNKYKAVKRRVLQLANLQAICFDASYFIKPMIEAKYGAGAFNLEMAQDIATSFAIQAQKEGLHLDLPTVPIDADWIVRNIPSKK